MQPKALVSFLVLATVVSSVPVVQLETARPETAGIARSYTLGADRPSELSTRDASHELSLDRRGFNFKWFLGGAAASWLISHFLGGSLGGQTSQSQVPTPDPSLQTPPTGSAPHP